MLLFPHKDVHTAKSVFRGIYGLFSNAATTKLPTGARGINKTKYQWST